MCSPTETHVAIDQHIKADGVGLEQCTVLSPIVHLVVLSIPDTEGIMRG